MSTKKINWMAGLGGRLDRLWSWFQRLLGLKSKRISSSSASEPKSVTKKLPDGIGQLKESMKSVLKNKFFFGTGTDEKEGSPEWYREAFRTCQIKPEHRQTIEVIVRKILWGKKLYQEVEDKVGLEWWIIGGLHSLEASCSFEAVLHNGERIIGTGKKTTLVPKGRGPFDSWVEAAVDALTLNRYRWVDVIEKGPEIGIVLAAVESFNGRGYISGAGKSIQSPYLWSMTSLYEKGKYVADGKFDPEAISKQVGFVAIVKKLEEMGEISIQIT